MQSDAAGNAANAQTQAGRDAINAQLAMYNQNRNDTMPYQATGIGALNALAQMYGLPTMGWGGGSGGITVSGGEPASKKKRTLFDKLTDPANAAGSMGGTSYDPMGFFSGGAGQSTTPLQFDVGSSGGGGVMSGSGTADFSQFYQTPDYMVAMEEGLNGLNRLAAARGGFRSGGHDADVMRFASNLGSQAFGNYQNNLFRLAGFGGQANSQLNSLGQNTASGVSNAMQNMGQSRASGWSSMTCARMRTSSLRLRQPMACQICRRRCSRAMSSTARSSRCT
ncbi:hypothetical protein [Pseudoxanthomonas indica]|nr:hypothetical protein [Pseudoxanthomonas indica]